MTIKGTRHNSMGNPSNSSRAENERITERTKNKGWMDTMGSISTKEMRRLSKTVTPENPFDVPRTSVRDDMNLSRGGLHLDLEQELYLAGLEHELAKEGMSLAELKALPRKAKKALIKRLEAMRTPGEKKIADVLKDRDHALDALFDPSQPFTRTNNAAPGSGGLIGRDMKSSHVEDVEEIVARLVGGIALERCQGPSLHHFSDYFSEGRNAEEWPEMFNDATPFLVEHDWAKAFDGAKDFDGGDIRLPFDIVCFEFRVKGIRILVFISQGSDEPPFFYVAMGINHRWYLDPGCFHLIGNKWRLWKTLGNSNLKSWSEQDNLPEIKALYNLLTLQIHAVCVMLDAEVAVHTPQRVSEVLSERRVKSGKTPLKSYHVVSLSKRARSDAYSAGDGTGTRKRMHFRRGHWRHYKDHKTWINWMLVGDPDLGFVDKHYKL